VRRRRASVQLDGRRRRTDDRSDAHHPLCIGRHANGTIDAAHPPYAFGIDSAPFGAIYAACDFTFRDAGSTGFGVDLAVHRDIRLPCPDPEAFDGLLMTASVLTPGMQNAGVSIQVCNGHSYISARASDCMIPVVQNRPGGTSFTATFTGCVLQDGPGTAPPITLDGTLTMSGCATR
jgi:hypothetical protein